MRLVGRRLRPIGRCHVVGVVMAIVVVSWAMPLAWRWHGVAPRSCSASCSAPSARVEPRVCPRQTDGRPTRLLVLVVGVGPDLRSRSTWYCGRRNRLGRIPSRPICGDSASHVLLLVHTRHTPKADLGDIAIGVDLEDSEAAQGHRACRYIGARLACATVGQHRPKHINQRRWEGEEGVPAASSG